MKDRSTPDIEGKSALELKFQVNGQRVEATIRPQEILLDVLRDRLGLKGTKKSCDMQICGACTVLVDGEPVSSCTYLALEANGKSILTIEGLGDEDRLDPIQQAFIDHMAFQCGYCTPGMILTARALLAENPAPTDDEIKRFMKGNLCRCTGYGNIIDAVRDAGSRMAER